MDSVADDSEWHGHARGSAEYRRILIALGAAGLATFAQLYSPQGLLPMIGRELQVSADRAALTISVSTFALALSVLAWSALADRIGRLPAMRIALIMAACLGLLSPLAPTFEALLILRFVEGVAIGGVPALAVTFLHEEVAAEHTAVAASSYISGTSIGGLLGRLVAAPFADLAGWRAGMVAVSVMAAFAVVIFLVAVPRARGFRPTQAQHNVWHGLSANLRDRSMLVLFAQGFLLMGGFVATYNYLTFRLEDPPFDLPVSIIALIFLAYLAGTASARVAGGLAQRYGRRPVLLISVAVMIIGVLITLPDWLPSVLFGLIVLTTGFFAAHSISAGWVGHRATAGPAQATSLYNLAYYGGSSLFGWAGGLAFLLGWGGTAAMVIALALVALLLAAGSRLR